MNAAAAGDEAGAERETGVPAPALVLVRTRQELSLGGEDRAGGIAGEPWPGAGRDLELAGGRAGPAGRAGQAMSAMDVLVALARLRPGQRQVIVEMFYLGRSVTGIAGLLGIPESTVRSRSYYGVRRLRRLLPARPGRGLSGRVQGGGS
jgi:hypothetical protein